MKKLVLLATATVIYVVVAFVAWRSLDKMGWILHRQITSVWSPVEQPWAIGEYLDCIASPRGGTMMKPGYGSPGIASLGCTRDRQRETSENLRAQDVQVTYWGRVAIPYPESARLYRRLMTTTYFGDSANEMGAYCGVWSLASVTCWAVN
jgi:hypothetical protein